MSRPYAPAPVDPARLRAWWDAGAWDQLAPHIQFYAWGAVCTVDLRDAATVADIVEDTLVRCWRLAYVPDSVPAFITTMARRIALDHRKTTYARRTVFGQDFDEMLDSQSDPLDRLVQRESRTRMRCALLQLPERYRVPLTLYYVDGQRVSDVAHRCGVNEGTMKMRLVRARQALHAAFDSMTQHHPLYREYA